MGKMVFQQYDRWRSHPIFHFTGIRDLKHLFPGFGTAAALFVVYLGYKQLIEPAFSSHDDHHHGDHHNVIIKGASHARELQNHAHHHHGDHHDDHHEEHKKH